MTTYNIPTGSYAVHAKVLVANAEDIVTIGDNVSSVRITIDAVASGSTAPVYVTADGSTATVAGANTFGLAAVVGAEMTLELATGATDAVHLISAGAHTYSVEKN